MWSVHQGNKIMARTFYYAQVNIVIMPYIMLICELQKVSFS